MFIMNICLHDDNVELQCLVSFCQTLSHYCLKLMTLDNMATVSMFLSRILALLLEQKYK